MHIYLILAHKNSAQLLDLLWSIYHKDQVIIIHFDKKASKDCHALGHALTEQYANIRVLPSEYCSWGGFSLVDAALRGMNYALLHFEAWTHFIVLSEQHLPLKNHDERSRSLQTGLSYLKANFVPALYESGRNDVLGRVSMVVEELAGVGCFGLKQAVDKDSIEQQLYHGSQWLILAKTHCILMVEAFRSDHNWSRFEQTLLSDETAIQSCCLSLLDKSEIVSDQTTLVAFPHLTGRHDLTFDESFFIEAQSSNFLFIRKRPPSLSLTMIDKLENLASVDGLALRNIYREEKLGSIAECDETASDLSKILSDLMASGRRVGNVERVQPNPVTAPTIFLRAPIGGTSLSICILSENLVDFRQILVWQKPFDGDYLPKFFGGFLTSLIRARVHGIFHLRQVHIPAICEIFLGDGTAHVSHGNMEAIRTFSKCVSEIADHGMFA